MVRVWLNQTLPYIGFYCVYFRAWSKYRDRMVGFVARGHEWVKSQGKFRYVTRPSGSYSFILTGASFFHKVCRLTLFISLEWINVCMYVCIKVEYNSPVLLKYVSWHVTLEVKYKPTCILNLLKVDLAISVLSVRLHVWTSTWDILGCWWTHELWGYRNEHAQPTNLWAWSPPG